MILASIVGTVVATRKDPRLVSNKLLLARPVDPQRQGRRQLPRRRRHRRRRRRRDRAHRQRQLGAHGVGHEGLPGRRRHRRHHRHVDVAGVTPCSSARVIGDVVATRKDASFDGITLLVVQPLAADGEAVGPAARGGRLGRRRRRRARVLRARQGSQLSRSIPPRCRPMPASSASSITGTIGRNADDPGARRRHGRLDAEAPQFEGAKLLLVQPRDAAGRAARRRRCWPSTRSAPASASGCSSCSRAAPPARRSARSWRRSTPRSSASSTRSTWRPSG